MANNALTESHDKPKKGMEIKSMGDTSIEETEARITFMKGLLADRMSLAMKTRFELRNPDRQYDASCSLLHEGECMVSMNETGVWPVVYYLQRTLMLFTAIPCTTNTSHFVNQIWFELVLYIIFSLGF
jgi:hypothetical protein